MHDRDHGAHAAIDEAAIQAIERPHPKLLTLFLLQSLVTLFLFPFVFTPLFFKYHTLRYRFDDEGVSARWGILFRKEVYLTYRRIQDIHVSRNLIERWLGIGKVEVQTASGSASAELAIEGMLEFGMIRDYLYAQMRGTAPGATSQPTSDTQIEGDGAEVAALLREIRDELDATRKAIEGAR